MNLIRQNNPWSLFDQLQRGLYAPTLNRVNDSKDAAAKAGWTPSVDISESETEYTLLANLPGVDPEAIEITAEKGVLSIKGELETESEEKGDNYLHIERQSGSFYRRFTLPDSADTDKIEAKAEHGVLKIVIPKQEVAVSRRIEVKH